MSRLPMASRGSHATAAIPDSLGSAGRRPEAKTPAKPAARLEEPAVRKRIKREEVVTFAHQMAMMVDTGVPLSEALFCVSEQASNESFAYILRQVSQRVAQGGDLSSALGEHPKVFPQVMVSLIRASELSGTMGQMLDRISSYLSKELATARKVRSALMYPAVMLVMVLGVTIFLLTFVLPRFAAIYADRGATLPLPTRILMGMSGFVQDHYLGIIGGVVATAVGLYFFLRSEAGRRTMDTVKLNVPVLGGVFRQLYVTRSCRTMGTMLNAGVPILDMIAIVKQVTQNCHYEALWDETHNLLTRGGQLSDALKNTDLFPKSVSQMISSGEKAGRLGATLEKIAGFTEEEFDNRVKAATQYIEPAMVVTMGSIIGFVAIALLLPIFTMGKVMSS